MKLAFSLVVGASLTASGIARAQVPDALPSPSPYSYSTAPAPMGETPMRQKRLPAPKNALELTVGTGYTQGFGSLRSGVGMPSVVTPGLGLELGIGFRANPHFAVLWSGQYQEFSAERASTAYGFTGSLIAQYHFTPLERIDPWAEVGFGYRLLVEDASLGPNLYTHGFQLGRARVGLDFRVDQAVALGPMIGADLTMFLFQDFPNVQTNISDPRVSMFVFAGAQGRFDIGGRTTETRRISNR